MSQSKSKCLYSNNCLQFLKRAIPLDNGQKLVHLKFTVCYGILLRFCSNLIHFVIFQFRFLSFRKFSTKFWSLSNWFKMLKFQTWRWRKLKKSISQIPSLNWTATNMLIKLDSDCRRQLRRLQRRKRHEGSGKIVAEVISSGKRRVLLFGIKKEYFPRSMSLKNNFWTSDL